jgi:putative phage-type endonuclease
METLVQGTDAWRLARCGSLGASRVSDAIARIKSGWGASRANLMAELVVERLTGIPSEGYQNAAMIWGTQTEPEARTAYEFRTDNTVVQVGLIRHPTIEGTHASPDGLIGDNGMLELKCPQSSTHLSYLLGESIPEKYITQCQWQMCCSGRKWVDLCSYDPRYPEAMRLFIKRIHRDRGRIAELETMVAEFLDELSLKVHTLNALYRNQEAA